MRSTTASTTWSPASAGFYRTWYVFIGLELGLFARVRDAGAGGLAAGELARRTGTQPALVERTGPGARTRTTSSTSSEGRLAIDDDIAIMLLDADRPEYLGGQFLHAAIGSLDYADLLDVFRTGTRVPRGPTATARPSSG